MGSTSVNISRLSPIFWIKISGELAIVKGNASVYGSKRSLANFKKTSVCVCVCLPGGLSGEAISEDGSFMRRLVRGK